ncbi:hypothetical protein AVEN_100735-1 [Araneus ventricosus]|uniref:Uncharacterized protein n=1 Tax=Araneus ventricosus TaxID=182803 RepID=A0A4Y2CT02_ARAVE|nr:hypothetical protein AVEN_100735-1 [Araneus ventricosus]
MYTLTASVSFKFESLFLTFPLPTPSPSSSTFILFHAVRIEVPEVDRTKTDARSILAVVLIKTEDGFYKLGTKAGILKQLYPKSEFSVCKERFLTKEDVLAVEISLHQTAIKQSLGTGQDFRQCDYKSKCSTNRL